MNQATAPWSTSLQMESKEASSAYKIELQGKPARKWCPPGTLADKVQAQQLIWGYECKGSQILAQYPEIEMIQHGIQPYQTNP